jgi:predicted phosphodiesterase
MPDLFDQIPTQHPPRSHTGLLCIGDPHLASRGIGFRKDDYPRTILGKFEWALTYAEQHRLLPIVLGDLFHYPRDNANWLIVQLLELFDQPILTVAGNHDCNANTLCQDDTLSILAAAGHVHLLDQRGPWNGLMRGTSVTIGGTCWGQELPERFNPTPGTKPGLVFWITHDDFDFPEFQWSKVGCREIPGVDVVINGHIHRPCEDLRAGSTTWLNPGNIARLVRDDVTRNRKPSVLHIDIDAGHWTKQIVEIPHLPFNDVFLPTIHDQPLSTDESLFIRGLAQLESLKTAGGAGLMAFLDQNVDQFEPAIATEIRTLAREVLDASEND